MACQVVRCLQTISLLNHPGVEINAVCVQNCNQSFILATRTCVTDVDVPDALQTTPETIIKAFMIVYLPHFFQHH